MHKLSKILGNIGWGLVVATTILTTTPVLSDQIRNGDGPTITTTDGKNLEDAVSQKEKQRKLKKEQRKSKKGSSTKKKRMSKVKKQQDVQIAEQPDAQPAKTKTSKKVRIKKSMPRKAQTPKNISSKAPIKYEQSPIDLKKNKACKMTTVAGAGFRIRYTKPYNEMTFQRTPTVIRFVKTEKAKAQKDQKPGLRERFNKWRKSGQNFITVKGEKYFFSDVDFHSPMVHSLDGKKSYPLEMHLLHKSLDGKIAVIGAFITEGKFNKPLDLMISRLDDLQSKNGVLVKSLKFHPRACLPPFGDAKYVFSYNGTTIANPEFTKNVKWIIYQAPIEMSAEQIAKIQKAIANKPLPKVTSVDSVGVNTDFE